MRFLFPNIICNGLRLWVLKGIRNEGTVMNSHHTSMNVVMGFLIIWVFHFEFGFPLLSNFMCMAYNPFSSSLLIDHCCELRACSNEICCDNKTRPDELAGSKCTFSLHVGL